EVLNGNTSLAHLASHALTLENLLRVHRADGARFADITLTTVGFAGAHEVVAFNVASETLTFGGANNVNLVANFEAADIKSRPWSLIFGWFGADFTDDF